MAACTILGSAHRNDIDPLAYDTDVITKLQAGLADVPYRRAAARRLVEDGRSELTRAAHRYIGSDLAG